MKALAPDSGVLGLIGLLSPVTYPQSQAGFLRCEGGKQIACGNNPCGTPIQHAYIGILGLRMRVFFSLLFGEFVIVACQLSRCKPIWCSAEISLGIQVFQKLLLWIVVVFLWGVSVNFFFFFYFFLYLL